jgi:AcrR family transcriptional regulator
LDEGSGGKVSDFFSDRYEIYLAVMRGKPAGRPPAFDRERALERAMRVFWKRGYEGASLHELTEAMGIRPPSLYAAFGNKQKLFQEALRLYLAGPASFMKEALQEKTALRVVERVLRGSAEFLGGPATRYGCMTIQAGMVGGAGSVAVRRRLLALRARGQEELRQRFLRAQEEGDLPKAVDAGQLARYVTTVFQGMAVQSIGGATKEELLGVAEMALRVWQSGV